MKDSLIPIISCNEFGDRIYKKTVQERIPIDGTIELTRRCNLKCPYCYAVSDPSKKELTYQQICRILDEVAQAGCLWLTITGGEPLLRKDFLDIYGYARKKGLIIVILTNGTMITRQIADYFKRHPPYLIEITLSGITAKTYEGVSGVCGSFERCLEGVRLLIERNITLKLKTTVTTLNVNELWEIKKYVEGLGIDFRFDAVLHPAVNGSTEPCKFRISPEAVLKLDLADKKRSHEWGERCQKLEGSPETDELYNCGAGINSFHINPYGELSICMLSRDSYNLCQGSFASGWHGFIFKIRKQKRKKEFMCISCSLSSLCGPCPDWAQLETADKERPVDYLCRISNLRAEAFGKEVRRKWTIESDQKDLIESPG